MPKTGHDFRCRLIGASRMYNHSDGAVVLVLQGTTGIVDSFAGGAALTAHVTWDQVMVREDGSQEFHTWTDVFDPEVPIEQLATRS